MCPISGGVQKEARTGNWIPIRPVVMHLSQNNLWLFSRGSYIGHPGFTVQMMYRAKVVQQFILLLVINRRRACAARVTVVGLCLSVCLSVCLSTTILGLQATRRLISDTNSFSATRA